MRNLAYKGYLTDGRVFDESKNENYYEFKVGDYEAESTPITGWHLGLENFKEGEKGRLIILYQLAYGDNGKYTVRNNVAIPHYETLVFDVELVEILPAPPESPTAVDEGDYSLTELGVRYYDIEEGSGEEVAEGQVATMHYTGWLEDGTMFDSSLLRGQAVPVMIGAGQLIPGWEQGMVEMKE